MTDQQNRPQTLLEAAKAMAELCKFTGTSSLCTTVLNHLRAAIAREEAKQDDNSLLHPLQWWMEEGRKRLDRAQQAESTAAWHKAESERLSQDLSDANAALVNVQRQARSLLDERVRLRQRAEKAEAELAVVKADCDTHRINAHEAAAAANCAPHDVAAEVLDLRQRAEKAEAEAARWKARADEAETAVASCWIAAAAMRERAEKAEAECREQRARAESGEDRNRDLSEKLIAAHGKTHAESERAKKAEAELATAKADTRAKAQNELRSIERALCSADVLNKFASLSRDAYSCHVHNTIETAISALRDDAATTPYSPPFEGDPKACAFTIERVPTELLLFAQASVDALSLLLKTLGGKS